MAAPPERDDGDAYRVRVLVATSFSHCMTHLYMLVFPSLVTPLRAELGMSLSEALSLTFLGYLLYGLGALPAGMISDRWSAQGMLVVCLAMSGSGALLAGFSHSGTMLTVALALMGLGASIYHPTGMALISRAFSARRGWALGVNGVWGNVGLAGAPFLTGLLTAVFGWRWAYLLLGAVGLLGALFVLLQPLKAPGAKPEAASAARVQERSAGDAVKLGSYFVVLCVAMTLGGLAYRSSSVVMPSYFEQKASFLAPVAEVVLGLLGGSGAKTAAATTMTSLVYIAGIFGQMLGGRIADSRDLRLSYGFFHLATIAPLLLMVWLVEVPLFVAATVYLVFSLGMQPIENSLVAKLSPARWRSTAYGLKFILTFGIGSFAVVIVGVIERASGLSVVFAMVAGLEVALVVAALWLWLSSRGSLRRLVNA